MKHVKLILAISILALAGCAGPRDPEVKAVNQKNLAGQGDYIGTLPDGRVIRCYAIDRGYSYPHYVYVVSDGSSVSLNKTEMAGKNNYYNRTIVTIAGKKFVEEK